MRRFSSYGQINPAIHYYAPRTELCERAYTSLIGENPENGGHYMTVWAPRQNGKSTVMLNVMARLRQQPAFDAALLTMQSAKNIHTPEEIINHFVRELAYPLSVDFPHLTDWEQLLPLFTSAYLKKPLILILDEFDALDEEFINSFANEFRKMYTARQDETGKTTHEKKYLLHGLALIGVRSVLGIENVSGSPFNVQRSLHIPNLTLAEVQGMFHWYEQESGQAIAPEVIDRLYDETNGHPGLTCWLGELLTEGYEQYQVDRAQPITMADFARMYAAATHILPSNTLINIISKAKQVPYKDFVLGLFETSQKVEFTFNEPHINFLYMHGVIDREEGEANRYYVKFSSPFIQKGLFDYFSRELFLDMGRLVEPFEPLDDALNEQSLALPNILNRYQRYLRKNSAWLFKHAPRRADLRIREAVYHFNLYMYLHYFLSPKSVQVWPEFPTGNGKLDILLAYRGQLYGLEVKSFADLAEYKKALAQAAMYAQQLGIAEITLVFFIDAIDADNRSKYELCYNDSANGVAVQPVFIETGM